MRVFKVFLNFDHEEQWLTEMLGSGHKLCANIFGYRFSTAQDSERKRCIRMDYREFSSRGSYNDYLQLMEDFGWEHICGSKGSGKQYFMEKAEGLGLEKAELFSTEESKGERYRSLMRLTFSMACCYFALWLSIAQSQGFRVLDLFNPSVYYFTPGLWEMKGPRFVGAFLFETPFALMRGYLWVFMLAVTCLFAMQALYGFMQVRRMRK